MCLTFSQRLNLKVGFKQTKILVTKSLIQYEIKRNDVRGLFSSSSVHFMDISFSGSYPVTGSEFLIGTPNPKGFSSSRLRLRGGVLAFAVKLF